MGMSDNKLTVDHIDNIAVSRDTHHNNLNVLNSLHIGMFHLAQFARRQEVEALEKKGRDKVIFESDFGSYFCQECGQFIQTERSFQENGQSSVKDTLHRTASVSLSLGAHIKMRWAIKATGIPRMTNTGRRGQHRSHSQLVPSSNPRIGIHKIIEYTMR